MKNPNVGQSVERIMEIKITCAMTSQGLSRHDAAQYLLSKKDGWYVQTPEGEYLEYVAATNKPSQEL